MALLLLPKAADREDNRAHPAGADMIAAESLQIPCLRARSGDRETVGEVAWGRVCPVNVSTIPWQHVTNLAVPWCMQKPASYSSSP